MIRFALPLLLLLSCFAPPPARAAPAAPFEIGAHAAWYVLGGVTSGGTVGVDDRGGYVGGELSVVRLLRGQFLGLYADAYYDFAAAGTYLTVGPEFGSLLSGGIGKLPLAIGADGGAAFRFAAVTRVGPAVRLFVSLFGLFSIYARYAYFNADRNDHVVQIGASLKLTLLPL